MWKRIGDVLASSVLLVVLSPVLAIVALSVWLALGRPVLFRQMRPGWRGRPFVLIKFRTMSAACEADGGLAPDAARLSRFGRVLRSLSLDELPELWNVLKGDMSLVGPRPLLMEYLQLYSERQSRRHEVRPGITGWAQVNGRNAVAWEERFELDIWYVEHLSICLDIRIVLRTILTTMRGVGISAPGEATMPAFTGTSAERKRSEV